MDLGSSQALAVTIVGLIALVAALGVSWIWWRNRQSERRVVALSATLSQVSGSRLNRDETLGRMLIAASEIVRSDACALFLPGPEGRLELVESRSITDFSHLAHLGPADPIMVKLCQSDDVLWTASSTSAWHGFIPGRLGHLGALRLGPHPKTGVMVFGWTSRLEAEFNLPALRELGREARRVTFEFGQIQRDARLQQREVETRQRREALLRTGAHDIGNRIQSIMGLLTRVQTSTQHPDVDRLLDQVELTGRMIEDMLQPDRRLDLEWIPVDELFQTISSWALDLQTSEIRITIVNQAAGALVRCDRLEILRVFDNLLRNAITHNPDATDLRIAISAIADQSGVEFEIRDNGRGIPLEAQPRLFEMGFRTDASGQIRGYGIGLASVHAILERHGAIIRLVSRPQAGATFSFRLPCR